jgi:hypothetical protein
MTLGTVNLKDLLRWIDYGDFDYPVPGNALKDLVHHSVTKCPS